MRGIAGALMHRSLRRPGKGAVMSQIVTASLVETVRRNARPITGLAHDYDPIMDLVGDRSLVLLGEATHGTHEFYQSRAHITRRLIQEKGFNAIAVEADWPDAYRVNRFVCGVGKDTRPSDALRAFERFPLWMWRNVEVMNFIDWLRDYNLALPRDQRVGFYGLDLYSLYSSISAVIEYLEQVDPEEAARARHRYACLDHIYKEPEHYGYRVKMGSHMSCRDHVVEQLIELRRKATDYLAKNGIEAEDEQFFAEQNARLVRNAEEYYRELYGFRTNTWNLRDRHMAETLAALEQHLARRGRQPRIVVWAHNSHIGDARATEMGHRGELNVGQLARERYGDDAILIGYTTHTGTVSAASEWGGTTQMKTIRPALPGSYESIFHQTGVERFILPLQGEVAQALDEPQRLQRAIGVIYMPQSERSSHYFYCHLPRQFDAVIHFDTTCAVEPLDHVGEWKAGPVPDTYPFAV